MLNKKVICNCCSHFQCSAVLPCSWRKLVLPGLLGHLRQMSAASSAGSKPTAGGGEPAGLNAAGSTTRKDTAASSGHTAGPASTTSVKAPAAAGGLPAGTEAAAATSGPAHKDAASYAVTSFDPDSVLPKDMDFVPWVPKEMSHKAEKREKKGDTSLAKRLMLGAFSTSVGWRPTGLNLGQARLFIERFPSEFRLGAMSKAVMPCCKGKAFVCPDGKLPCPFLSTCSALKLIEKKTDIAGDCDPQAWKDIQKVLEKGVQVEWVEFDDYMSYMIYCEGIAVQSDVNLHRIIDALVRNARRLSGAQGHLQRLIVLQNTILIKSGMAIRTPSLCPSKHLRIDISSDDLQERLDVISRTTYLAFPAPSRGYQTFDLPSHE